MKPIDADALKTDICKITQGRSTMIWSGDVFDAIDEQPTVDAEPIRRDLWKSISNLLIIALALIAAVVATGLIAGFSMWAWIVAYWVTLTAKNIVDCIGQAMKEVNDKQQKEES